MKGCLHSDVDFQKMLVHVYHSRVLSIGGRREASPQSTQLLPQKEEQQEKKREGGDGECILFGCYDNTKSIQ